MSTAVVPIAAAPQGEVRRRRRWLGAAAALLALTSAPLWLFLSRQRTPLPVLYTLPTFALSDERGQPFGTAQLQGTPYIADFIYTGCRDACPLLTARMGELQERLKGAVGAVRLVSFTVDPVHDQPASLAIYAREAKADPALWSFVTGPPDPIANLLHDGFKVAMEGDPQTPATVLHDDHLVLVDARGRVRGYFAATAKGLREIGAALKQIVSDPQG